jgi:hypothetical protein
VFFVPEKHGSEQSALRTCCIGYQAGADVIFSATVGGHGWPESSPMDGLWRVAEKTSRSKRDFEEMQYQVALTLSERK